MTEETGDDYKNWIPLSLT